MKILKFFVAFWLFLENYWWVLVCGAILCYASSENTPIWELLMSTAIGFGIGVFMSTKAIKRLHNRTIGKVLKSKTYVEEKENQDN